MFAIRARRKVATEKDFLSAVDKVIKGNLKFNSTATYMQYNQKSCTTGLMYISGASVYGSINELYVKDSTPLCIARYSKGKIQSYFSL